MGTRGFLGIVIDGAEKIAYNHLDSYPDGLGVDTLRSLRGAPLDAEKARALRVVDPESTPSAEDIERLKRFADTNVSSKQLDDWYVLLRRTMGDLPAILDAGVVLDGSEFPGDSLFCEWGYLVDLDTQTLEVYRGFQKEQSAGRFARHGRGDNGYYPVAPAASWPLAELPDDEAFLAALAEPS